MRYKRKRQSSAAEPKSCQNTHGHVLQSLLSLSPWHRSLACLASICRSMMKCKPPKMNTRTVKSIAPHFAIITKRLVCWSSKKLVLHVDRLSLVFIFSPSLNCIISLLCYQRGLEGLILWILVPWSRYNHHVETAEPFALSVIPIHIFTIRQIRSVF